MSSIPTLHRLYAIVLAWLSIHFSAAILFCKGSLATKTQDTVASPTSPTSKPEHRDEAAAKPSEIQTYKKLYHQLQNLEQFPEVLPQARNHLVAFLSDAISQALEDPTSTILSVENYTQDGVAKFLQADNDRTTTKFEEYMARRRAGGPREMFADKEVATWWLKQAAPVKYVDGAWLSHINKISTPFALRRITKNAWQTMSEELGDGDLEKNHVHIYRELMKEINAGLPDGDSPDFIHPRHGLDQHRVWKAALAQQVISLFPHDFLPEALGFNMAYEGLPLHLMVSSHELQELKLNAYYFVLHISIDNGHSGHAAMGLDAATDYVQYIREREGEVGAQQVWRRIQAGFLLAEALPTTPELAPAKKSTSDMHSPRHPLEDDVINIFREKAPVAHKIHCSSKIKIGPKTLVQWLEPEAFTSKQWQKDFLDTLSNNKPWIIRGDSEKSKLVQEVSWGGRMFGCFTQSEVEVVKAWIGSLKPNDYWSFVGRKHTPYIPEQRNDIRFHYPVIDSISPEDLQAPSTPFQKGTHGLDNPNTSSSFNLNLDKFIPLWFSHPCLLENFVAVPAKTPRETVCAIVRLLRAQAGFELEGPGVAGMDEVRRTNPIGLVELGIEMMSASGLQKPSDLREALDGRDEAFALTMLRLSMKPIQFENLLIGLSWAFMELHEMIAEKRDETESCLLSAAGRKTLRQIARRERRALMACLKEVEGDEEKYEEFRTGYSLGRFHVDSCLTSSAVIGEERSFP